MPKIRVESDVPDGEKCWGCHRMTCHYDEDCYCELFLDAKGMPKILDEEGRRLPQCIAAEVKDAGSGWRDIAEAPLGKKVLVLFSNGHIEDAEFFDDGYEKYYVFYDGESLTEQPTHFLPIPPPPVGK